MTTPADLRCSLSKYLSAGAILTIAIGLFAPAPARAADVSAMPLGDSITAGSGFGGYRAQLATDLTAAGHTFHLLGSQVMTDGGETAASLRPPYDGLHHEGHGGWRIDQLDANLDGNPNTDASGNGGYFITGGNGTGRDPVYPDFVLVLAGINDINQYFGQKQDAGQQMDVDELLPILQGRVTSLVDNLSTLRPSSHILLSNVIPYANGLLSDQVTGATTSQRQIWGVEDGVSPEQELGVNHYVIRYNKWLEEQFVPNRQAAGVKIELVDQYQNFILPDGSVRGWGPNSPDGYIDYGLHPNQFGYDLMGATWAAAINQALSAGTLFEATIDRLSGSITLINTSGEALSVTSLTISSVVGAIDVAELTPITGNYDGNGNQAIDDQPWTITDQSGTLFRETSTLDSGTFGVGAAIELSPSSGWIASAFEDLQITVQLADGTTALTNVNYVGNGGHPLPVGDLDGNGVINRADYLMLAQYGETTLSGLSRVEAYRSGDLNGDGVNDYLDFRMFKDDYIAQNGAAAFARMISVPEPSSLVLLCVALLAGCGSIWRLPTSMAG